MPMPTRPIPRNSLIKLAAQEEGVSVLTNSKRVSEYFASYSQFAGKNSQAMLQTSWCQLFINWVLVQSGYPVFQRTYSEWMANSKNSDFSYVFKAKNSGYVPKPGDIYYSPIVGSKKTEHMGFIVKVHGNGYYRTLDGNTAKAGHPLYSKSLWSGTKSGQLIGGIGGGVVCFNERQDNGGTDVGIVGFIPLPPMFRTSI